ncbi:MAG TPA: helix-turn-helix transcriptional regulator [Candidatus Limnocylindrales bacterium]|nr:helix-turn-helix transcriptional regulator [Candidatus Limnocylindrales bacterium]
MSQTALERDAARAARKARETLAEDIERQCADAGLSHGALARAAGLNGSTLSRIFAGDLHPSIETYARLAAALGADLATRLYPTTGPAIRDGHSVAILEAVLQDLHRRWHPYPEVRVWRPSRGWIDTLLHEPRDRLAVATEIQSALARIEQVVRWSEEKAVSLPSWDGWPTLGEDPSISRLLVVRWTRTTREAAAAAERQLRLAYPAHPDDALASLTGTVPWPGPALVWAREDRGRIRLIGRR